MRQTLTWDSQRGQASALVDRILTANDRSAAEVPATLATARSTTFLDRATIDARQITCQVREAHRGPA